MTMNLIELIEDLARRKKVELSPNWSEPIAGSGNKDLDAASSALAELVGELGWEQPVLLQGDPKPEQFPLIVHSQSGGWAIADQWEAEGLLRVQAAGETKVWHTRDGGIALFDLRFPLVPAAKATHRAFDVFVRAIRRRPRMFVDAVLATVVLNIITVATSLYTMQVYDRVVPHAGLSTLWVLTLGVVLATITDFILRVVRSIMLEKESAAIDAEVSEFFFARAQAVRLDARQGGIGTMAAQLRGYEQIRSLLSSASIFAIADLPFALFFVWVIFVLAGPIALVPLASFIIAIGMAVLFARLIRNQSDGVQAGNNRKSGLMVESLDAAETIKSTRGAWQMIARWNRLVAQVDQDDYSLKRISAFAQSAGATIQQVAYVAMIAWGALEIIDGKITAGSLIAASIISGRVNGPLIGQLPGLIVQSSYARSALKGLDSLLELPLDRDPQLEYVRPSKLGNELRTEQVTFVYPGARSGVVAPKLAFGAGERIGIIGPVGSGKTTLLKMLAGLFPPQQGAVFVGGIDMAQIAEEHLRKHIGYMGQEFRLVSGTLRDQLTLGLGDPGDDRILAAAAATGLDKLIAAHPMGLDLPISEGGRGLSGGQRALTGLTRLILAKPRIWMLDEPTAALDQESEEKALKALLGAMGKDDTLVFVTHKLQLLQLVQRVVVVVNGQIVRDGPTANVLSSLRPPAPKQMPANVKGDA